MLSVGLWRWYINITITILNIIRPVFYLKHDVSETRFFLRLQVETTHLGSVDRASLCLRSAVKIHKPINVSVIQHRQSPLHAKNKAVCNVWIIQFYSVLIYTHANLIIQRRIAEGIPVKKGNKRERRIWQWECVALLNNVFFAFSRQVYARFEPFSLQKTSFSKIGEVTAHQIIMSENFTPPYSLVRDVCPGVYWFRRVACPTRSP
jgi:hypothetical protein